MNEERRLDSAWMRRLPERPAFWALAGAMLFGLMGQGMGLFNKFSWHDDIFSIFLTGATITSGRWMLHVLSWLEVLVFGDGHFSLPLVNGLASLICIGASAALIVTLFKIRSRTISALLGGVMAVFPVITAMFGFMFTVHYYMLGLLMMTGCVFLVLEDGAWWKKMTGVLLGAGSVGIYQAFLPLLLSLTLLYDFLALREKAESLQAFLKRVLIQAVCIAAVMVLYFALSHLFLAVNHLEMDSYMGMNQMGSVTAEIYLERLARACGEFFRPTRNVLTDMYPQHVYYLYYAMLAADAVLGIRFAAGTWKTGRGKALLQLLLLALVPLGCNLIFVMSEEVHSLMVYGQTAQFMLLTVLADRSEFRIRKACRPAPALAAALLLLTNIMYIRYDNQCYLKTNFQQQEAISWNTTLVTRIKSAPGYRDELPVAWVNRMEMTDLSLYNIDELNFLQLAGYHQPELNYVNSATWEAFLARWCGFGPETVPQEAVEDWPEVRDMPSYPDADSIRVIRDVVVVKFSGNAE